MELRRSSNLLMDLAQEALDQDDGPYEKSASFASEPKINQLAVVLDRLLRSTKGTFQDYRMYISEEKIKIFGNNSNNSRGELKVGQPIQQKKTTKRVIKYWCFSTGVALEDLVALKIRSVIVTSGTLSPMEAMKEDMRIPFTIELQNPHVIQ